MSDPRPARVQIFGERCSGTNYVAQLVRRNLRGLRLVDDFGWKHGWIRGRVEDATDCLFVVVHRDPFDWLRSLHGKPWHAAAPLRDVPIARFLREEWWCEWGRDMELADDDPRHGTEMVGERDPQTRQRFANVMRMRTAKLRAWDALRTRARHAVFVRYEDVMQQPKRFVRACAGEFGLRRWPWFRDVRTFKGGSAPFQPKTYALLEPGDLDWILSQLDVALERRQGFDVEARAAELRAAWSAQQAASART